MVLGLDQASIPISIPFTLSLPFSFPFPLTFSLAFSFAVRISIIPTIHRPLSAALFLLHGSCHTSVVVHRIQDSLHQSLVCVRVVVLSRSMRWVTMLWVLVVRILVVSPATAFITHGSSWGVIR
jgi:hypothetical protein